MKKLFLFGFLCVLFTTIYTQSHALTFAANSGTITSPFIVSGGTVYQTTETTLVGSGKAVYNFPITISGDYLILIDLDAPHAGANSFFVNIDAEPTDPYMVWQIPITTGIETRTVSWQGNGTWDNSEFVPKVFTLTAGTHQLIIRGREPNTKMQSITILSVIQPPVITNITKNVTLAWDASPSVGISGYKVYFGGISRTYTNVTHVGNVLTTTISNLITGNTYFFAITAVNLLGIESDFSNELFYTVPGTNSVPVTNLPPTISNITDKSMLVNTISDPINFTVYDVDSPINLLSITFDSSNKTLVNSNSFSLSSISSNNTLTIKPLTNQIGVTEITAIVRDNSNNVSSDKFLMVVTNISIVNLPPAVNAGPDFSVFTGVSTNLNGSASDDGLPNNTLSTTWSKVSGPGIVTFGNSGILSSPVSFSSAGAYVLNLRASDSVLVANDTINVNVVSPPSNTGPLISAGFDRYVSKNSSILAGSATDDGLPINSVLKYTWTKANGSNPVIFSSTTNLTTSVKLPSPGTYTFRLTVTDGAITRTDDVKVFYIRPPVYFNDILYTDTP